MNLLAVFRSRSQALDFTESLKRCGVPAQTVATPSNLKIGCSLSCKFPSFALDKAKRLAASKRYSSYFGLYQMLPIVKGYELVRFS